MSSPIYSYSESNYNSDSDNNAQQSSTPLKVTLKLKLPKPPTTNNSYNEYSRSASPEYESSREGSYGYSRSSKHYSPARNSYRAPSSNHSTSNVQSETYSYSEASELTEYDYSDDEKTKVSRVQPQQRSPSPIQPPPAQPKFKIKLKLNQSQEKPQPSAIHQSPAKPKILLKLPANPPKQISTQPKKSLVVKLLLPQLSPSEPRSSSQGIAQHSIADSSPAHELHSLSVRSAKNEEARLNSTENDKSPIHDQTHVKPPSPKKEDNVVIDLSNEPEDFNFKNDDDDDDDETLNGSEDDEDEDDEDDEQEDIKTDSDLLQQNNSLELKKTLGRKGKKKRGRPPASKAESVAVSEASKAPSATPINVTPSRYLYPVIQRLISRLERKDDYALFLQPVDTSAVDDYLTVIKQPMDLSTMRKKIDNREYTHIDQFKEDLILLCNNAMTYNGPDTLYYKEAGKLKEFGVSSINKQTHYIIPYDPSQHPPTKDQDKSLESENKQAGVGSKAQGSASKTRREESVDILDFPGAYPPSSTRSPSVSGMSQTTVATSSKRRKYFRPPVLPPKPPFNPDGSVEYVGQPETTFWDHFAYGLPPVITHLLPPNANAIDHLVYQASHMDYGTYPQLIDSLQSSDPLYLINPAKLTELDPQNAILFGDGRGMAYMSSLEKFSEGMDPMVKEYIKNKLNYVTNGSYTNILNQRAKSNTNGQHIQPMS